MTCHVCPPRAPSAGAHRLWGRATFSALRTPWYPDTHPCVWSSRHENPICGMRLTLSLSGAHGAVAFQWLRGIGRVTIQASRGAGLALLCGVTRWERPPPFLGP